MTASERAFLERAVVQLLFVTGREFSLENLRATLREVLAQTPDATCRAAASVTPFELLQTLLGAGPRLERLGLRLDLRAGSVRLTTAEVQPAPWCAHLEALSTAARLANYDKEETPGGDAPAGPLSRVGLEVLACVAFKQPLSLAELNAYFAQDKRAVLLRLQHLGLVDCRRAGETERLVWTTTAEFLRRFHLQSPADLERLLREAPPGEAPHHV